MVQKEKESPTGICSSR